MLLVILSISVLIAICASYYLDRENIVIYNNILVGNVAPIVLASIKGLMPIAYFGIAFIAVFGVIGAIFGFRYWRYVVIKNKQRQVLKQNSFKID
ncbi:MAG: hypothetical protein FWF56_05405 [Firmicutes bacterium]|nr:hypothetical protein [Bacillota bacterium]MCL1953992.1 hypothetical protein [Bacillota bacterium]